jgi:hypothetical protein
LPSLLGEGEEDNRPVVVLVEEEEEQCLELVMLR